MISRRLVGLLAGAALLGGLGAPAAAQDEAAYFRGKTIRLSVGFGPGGGYDAYARMIAPYLSQRLQANVVVENQPGAGGLTALNNLSVAEPDGTRMMLVNGTSAGLAQVLETPGVRFDLQTMSQLGTVSASPWIWLVHKEYPLKTPADFQKAGKEIAWAASGPIDGLSDGALVTCEVLKIKCKVVMGYKGSNDAGLAVTRREMDAIYVSDTSANNYVRSNDMHAVANMSRKRSRFFPELPTIFDAVKLSPEDEWLMDFHGAMEDLGRILVAPPKMAPARLAYLQSVVKDALADPRLKEDGEKSQRYIDYIDAAATTKAVRAAITDVTPEQKKRVQTLLNAK